MSISVSIGKPSVSVSIGASSVGVSTGTPVAREYIDVEVYDGAYEVTPQAHEEQILPTRNKRMADDLTVLRVPYFETSNIYGNTAYIASEVE